MIKQENISIEGDVMPKFLISLFTIAAIFITSAPAQRESFVERILNDLNCQDCSYLLLEIKSEPYAGKVIIENDDLFRLLKAKRDIDENRYRELIKRVVRREEPLNISGASLYGYGSYVRVDGVQDIQFAIVKPNEMVNEVAAKGCVYFIQHFFLDQTSELPEINDGTKDCEELIAKNQPNLYLRKDALLLQAPVIAKLFEWSIAVKRDDYSGFLIIDRRDFKKTPFKQ